MVAQTFLSPRDACLPDEYRFLEVWQSARRLSVSSSGQRNCPVIVEPRRLHPSGSASADGTCRFAAEDAIVLSAAVDAQGEIQAVVLASPSWFESWSRIAGKEWRHARNGQWSGFVLQGAFTLTKRKGLFFSGYGLKRNWLAIFIDNGIASLGSFFRRLAGAGPDSLESAGGVDRHFEIIARQAPFETGMDKQEA